MLSTFMNSAWVGHEKPPLAIPELVRVRKQTLRFDFQKVKDKFFLVETIIEKGNAEKRLKKPTRRKKKGVI